MTNQAFAKSVKPPVDSIGLMVYEGTGSLQYLPNYLNGAGRYGSINVDVPPQYVMLGAGGQSGSGTIEALAKAAHDKNLGGIMVWYASVIDKATGKVRAAARAAALPLAGDPCPTSNSRARPHPPPARGKLRPCPLAEAHLPYRRFLRSWGISTVAARWTRPSKAPPPKLAGRRHWPLCMALPRPLSLRRNSCWGHGRHRRQTNEPPGWSEGNTQLPRK